MTIMILIAALLLLLGLAARLLVAASPLLSTLSIVVESWGYSVPAEEGEQAA